MGLLDVHADGIRQAFDFSLRAPVPEEPPASFRIQSFAGAGFKSLARAGLETAANLADLGAALQQGNINALPAADLTEAQRAAHAEEFQRLKGQFQQAGEAMRLRSAELAPDPLTAHRADQVISGVGTGVARAAGAIATLGPVAGSAVFGAGEADTTYQDAIARGIDPATAAKLAATTGVVSGLTAGLPAGGPGVRSTLGIAAAAGPGSYVAQEAISRKILQSAGYPDEAAMHDPTDPLGLALSIVLPGVAGGLHIRSLVKQKSLADIKVALESGGKRFGPDGQLLESPAGALGEHQVLRSTAADPGFGIPPAKPLPSGKPDPDELARVGTELFASHLQHFDGDGAKALAAYNAGRAAVDAAVAKHGDAWLAHMPDDTRAYVDKGMKQFGDHAIARAGADPETVDAARVRVTNSALLEHLPDHPEAVKAVQDASDLISRGETPDVLPIHEEAPSLPDFMAANHIADTKPPAEVRGDFFAWVRAQGGLAMSEKQDITGDAHAIRGNPAALFKKTGRSSDDLAAAAADAGYLNPDQAGDSGLFRELVKDALNGERVLTLEEQHLKYQRDSHMSDREVRMAAAERKLKALGVDASHAGGNLNALEAYLAQHGDTLANRALDEVNAASHEPLVRARPREAVSLPTGEKTVEPPADMFQPRVPGTREAQPKFEQAPPKPEPPGTPPKPAGEPAMVKAAPESLEVQRAEALIADNPGLWVQLPGSTETVSAAEALARVKSEAEHDAGAAELIRAAIQCALTFGE